MEHKELLEKIQSDVKSIVDAKNTENTKAIEDVKSLIADLKASDKSNEFATEISKIAADLKALQETPVFEQKSYKTPYDAILASLIENKSLIENAIDKKSGALKSAINIELKAAVTMQEDNTIGAGTTQYTITSNTGIISKIRKRSEVYLANVSVGTLSGDQALWIEELDEQGTPIFLGEGDAATQLSVRYEEQTKSVKEISVYGKVTNRMLEDLPMLASYINNNLEKRMDLKVEDQLFDGNDTGDNLAGAIGYATAFDAGSAAGTVTFANEWDVLEAIAKQAELAYGIANGVYVHPSTIQAMKARKTTTGEPIWKYYQDTNSPSGLSVAGMNIISTPAITAGDFLGGDLTVLNVLFRQNTTIEIGRDGSDLTQRKKTIVMTKRLVQFVSANDTPVLITGDFASAIADLLLI